MAELSVDEAQRLARLFLTGQAQDSDIQRLGGAIADDQGAALELLAQMQTALDDSAPAGLTGEQDRSVNGRIEALIAPRVKKRGAFSFLTRLFKRKPKVEEEPKNTRTRRRGAAAEPAPTPAPEPVVVAPVVSAADDLGDTMPGAGMEETMPSAAAPVAPPPLALSSEPAPAPAPSKAEKKPLPAWLMPALGVLLLLGLIGAGAAWWMKRPKPLKPVIVPVLAVPTPMPSPTPTGRAHRGRASAGNGLEPLPAEIHATTPIAAGSSNIKP